MAKLTNLKPRLGTAPQRIVAAGPAYTTRDQQRIAEQPWRRLYRTAPWSRLRQKVFLRDLYTCRMCKHVEGNTSKLVCDHITPHRGNLTLFWDERNLQTLCKPCHDITKQAEEASEIKGTWY